MRLFKHLLSWVFIHLLFIVELRYEQFGIRQSLTPARRDFRRWALVWPTVQDLLNLHN